MSVCLSVSSVPYLPLHAYKLLSGRFCALFLFFSVDFLTSVSAVREPHVSRM